MGKSESIKKLEELGLNALDYYTTKDKREVMHYLAKHADDLVSMRTEKGNDFQCPFFYSIPGKNLVQTALEHLDKGYILIFSGSLDTKGCLAFGTIALGETEDVIEIVFGEGKVRELDTHPNKHSITVQTGRVMAVDHKQYPGKAHMINQLHKIAKESSYDQVPCILEFSYYSYPVGRLNRNDVWWEIRDWR